MLIFLFSLLFSLLFTCSVHFLIHCVNISIALIPLPPILFFSSSPPLLICELNYSVLPGLLILLIEPITFWLDQCGKGNDLNGCRIKPHNHFNWCKRKREREGGRRRMRRKEQKEGGLTGEGNEYPLFNTTVHDSACTFKCFILCLCLYLLYATM